MVDDGFTSDRGSLTEGATGATVLETGTDSVTEVGVGVVAGAGAGAGADLGAGELGADPVHWAIIRLKKLENDDVTLDDVLGLVVSN